MREIKFRVRFVPENDWMILTLAEVCQLGVAYGNYKDWMQFTGLHDKNGKEIYEGDVVIGRYEHYDPCADASIKDEKMGGVVFWDLYQWSFKVIEKFCDQDREGKCNYFDYHDEKDYWAPQVFEDMEVIGNIYENPELLTKN